MTKFIRLCVALVVLATAMALCGCETDGDIDRPVDYSYSIESVDITINVDKDRTAHVTENYTVNFNKDKRGIVRFLPTNSGERYKGVNVTFPDGQDDKYFVTVEDGYVCINTGTKDDERSVFYRGKRQYTISYTVVPPIGMSDTDDYYMNVVGHGWSTSQRNVSVNMNLPFDIGDIKIYYGRRGSTDTLGSENYVVDGSNLSINIDKLEAYQGVTAMAYVGKGKFGYNYGVHVIIILVAVAMLIAAYLLRRRYGDILPLAQVDTFYPPQEEGKEMTPTDLGMIIDNSCDNGDLTSLIFYWASRGYLEIRDEDADMTLVKKKDLDSDANGYENLMFHDLFDGRNEVCISDLEEKFYTTIDSCKRVANKKYHGKFYEKKSNAASLLSAAVLIIVNVIIHFVGAFMLDSSLFYFYGIFTLVPSVVMYIWSMSIVNRYYKMTEFSRRASKVLAIVVAIILGVIAALIIGGGIYTLEQRIILDVATTVAVAICPFMSKRTSYYNGLLRQAIGFAHFLRVAEKEKLEMLLADNPQYYYDILPYANVLGVSKIWQDKFDGLTLEPPSYYVGVNTFTLMRFNAFYNMSYDRANTVLTSHPNKSSSSGGGFHGGFGGGGFSGGGFGGGGGGSR